MKRAERHEYFSLLQEAARTSKGRMNSEGGRTRGWFQGLERVNQEYSNEFEGKK